MVIEASRSPLMRYVFRLPSNASPPHLQHASRPTSFFPEASVISSLSLFISSLCHSSGIFHDLVCFHHFIYYCIYIWFRFIEMFYAKPLDASLTPFFVVFIAIFSYLRRTLPPELITFLSFRVVPVSARVCISADFTVTRLRYFAIPATFAAIFMRRLRCHAFILLFGDIYRRAWCVYAFAYAIGAAIAIFSHLSFIYIRVSLLVYFSRFTLSLLL